MSSKKIWPSIKEEINNENIQKAPFGVLSDYSDAVYEAYDKKIIGVITTSFKEKGGNRTNFVYGLYLNQLVDKQPGPQIKILEVKVQDDGWYDAEVCILFPVKESIGIAKNEAELDQLLNKAINRKETKVIISQLLK